VEHQPEVIADRAYALATCPAKAPAPWVEADARGPLQDAKQMHNLDSAIRAVQSQFDRLTDAQRSQWWLDLPNNRVVLQVTHNPDAVLSELGGRVGDPTTVALELVRYSRAQLNEWAQRIIAMDDIGWSSVGFENPNNRIEVQVRGNADDAWRRIVRAVEPCAFRVQGGIVIDPLEEGRS
jgi:hypothetical protein